MYEHHNTERTLNKIQDMNISYRKLTRDQICFLKQIDRSEIIRGIYHQQNGRLILENKRFQVPDWSDAEKAERTAELQEIFDQGATFFGAICGKDFAGMSVLNHKYLMSRSLRLNLTGLWVSNRYRGRGIGKALFRCAQQEAQARGAKSMYVSATPSKNTVDFYIRLGCVLAAPLDQILYQEEPEDIHLEIEFA